MRNCTGCSMKNRSRFVSSEKDTRCKYKWEIQTFVITFRFIFEHRWPAYSASCPFLSFFLSNFSKFDRYIRFDFVESFVIKNRRTYEIYIYTRKLKKYKYKPSNNYRFFRLCTKDRGTCNKKGDKIFWNAIERFNFNRKLLFHRGMKESQTYTTLISLKRFYFWASWITFVPSFHFNRRQERSPRIRDNRLN